VVWLKSGSKLPLCVAPGGNTPRLTPCYAKQPNVLNLKVMRPQALGKNEAPVSMNSITKL